MLVRYFVPIVAVHVLCLAALVPAFFSWTAVVLCLAGVHVFGQTITLGYHRLLAHRSFSTPRWFEHLLVVGALCCLEDSPARWIATHRMHHAHSDEREDPHTPMVTFLWGHMWWLLVRNRDLHHRANYERYARDVLRDPFYMWIEKHPWSPLWFYGAQEHAPCDDAGGEVRRTRGVGPCQRGRERHGREEDDLRSVEPERAPRVLLDPHVEG
ncbi:MAG: fatty acid desaturase, partial [Phycisphaerales bacterium]